MNLVVLLLTLWKKNEVKIKEVKIKDERNKKNYQLMTWGKLPLFKKPLEPLKRVVSVPIYL